MEEHLCILFHLIFNNSVKLVILFITEEIWGPERLNMLSEASSRI